MLPDDRPTMTVACDLCGWSANGHLTLVDRYLTDSPPVPRGDGQAFLELYLDDSLDPDSRVDWCRNCGEPLTPTDVIGIHDHAPC